MKILIVNCVFDPEPIVSAKIGKDIAEYIQLKGHDVSVICPKPSRPFGFKFIKRHRRYNFKFVELNSFNHPKSGIIGRLVESISFGLASYKYINKSEIYYDRIYMNTWPLFAQLGVAIAAKKKKSRYIVHIQDIYPESLTNKLPRLFKYFSNILFLPIDKYIIKNAYKVITISESMKAYLKKTRMDSDHLYNVVLNWQEDILFEQYQNIWENSKLTFMYLGNIGPVSNLPFVINAFINTKLDAKLIIAGSGSLKEKCIQIVMANSSTDIEFLDVPDGQVPKIQSQAHELILPMLKGAGKTSIPSKLPAYMFSAKPILAIVENSTDIALAINDANCGWIIAPDDEEAVKNSFINISKLPLCVLKEKGEKSLRYAKKKYSKDINLNYLVNIILE